MRFETKDNLRYFNFEEVSIMDVELTKETVTLVLKGLIVKGTNPNNEECVDRFVDIVNMRFLNGAVTGMVKEGFKYYDANGKLLKEKPDEAVVLTDIDRILKQCKDVPLYDVVAVSETQDEKKYQIGIDLNEDDTYWIDITCSGTVMEWERFMNRVTY